MRREHPQVVGKGARRSGRFDVARSPALAEYSKFAGLLTPKRPEGRAPKSRQFADALRCAGADLFFRKLPDPVAWAGILNAVERILDLPNDAAIILFIPTNRIKNELAIACPTVLQRFAGDYIVGQLQHESRYQRVEIFGKLSVGKAEPLERTGDLG